MSKSFNDNFNLETYEKVEIVIDLLENIKEKGRLPKWYIRLFHTLVKYDHIELHKYYDETGTIKIRYLIHVVKDLFKYHLCAGSCNNIIHEVFYYHKSPHVINMTDEEILQLADEAIASLGF
jgi:hypothetical protein